MFYRIRQAYAITDRIRSIERVSPQKPVGLKGESIYAMYKRTFEPIPPPDNISHCRLYRAPLLPHWHHVTALVVDMKSGEFPELYFQGEELFVSQRFREVLEQVEPGFHQFWPTEIRNRDGERVTRQAFYTLNVRRHVVIGQMDEVPHKGHKILPGEWARRFLPSVLEGDPVLRAALEALPLWINRGNMDAIYINEPLFDRLHQAGVTGIDEVRGPVIGEATAERI